MFVTFHRLANTNFRASHRVPLSGFGLPSVANSNFRASNGGILSVQAQPFVLFSHAVLLRFAARGLNLLRSVASRRLTLHSSGLSKATLLPSAELLR
jgi:hypothetical protein